MASENSDFGLDFAAAPRFARSDSEWEQVFVRLA